MGTIDGNREHFYWLKGTPYQFHLCVQLNAQQLKCTHTLQIFAIAENKFLEVHVLDPSMPHLAHSM